MISKLKLIYFETAFLLFLVFLYLPSDAQESTSNRVQLGVQFSTGITREVYHFVPRIALHFKAGHELFVGTVYTHLYKALGDPVDEYKKETFGVYLGYRYNFREFSENLIFFGQLDFSIYQVISGVYQHGLPDSVEHRNLMLENSGTLGLEYKLSDRFYVYSNIGIQSYKGFFLMIERFSPCAYAGIEYRFE